MPTCPALELVSRLALRLERRAQLRDQREGSALAVLRAPDIECDDARLEVDLSPLERQDRALEAQPVT